MPLFRSAKFSSLANVRGIGTYLYFIRLAQYNAMRTVMTASALPSPPLSPLLSKCRRIEDIPINDVQSGFHVGLDHR